LTSSPEHFEAIWQNAGEPAEPDPNAYPPPAENPERYGPITKARYEADPVLRQE
jgi:hypothetical protein